MHRSTERLLRLRMTLELLPFFAFVAVASVVVLLFGGALFLRLAMMLFDWIA